MSQLPRWAWVAIGAGLLVAAFSAGRFSAPVQTEVQEVEKIVYQDRVVEKVVVKRAKAEEKVVFIDRTITDAGVHELITERTKTDETEKTKDEVDRTTSAEKQREQKATTTLRPDWRIGALVGASLREPALPLSGNLVLGVQVERRVVGGVSVGAWANTVGAAGGVVSVEF